MEKKISGKLEADVLEKLANCREILRSLGSVVVAFSGGADSTLILQLATETLGRENVLAVLGVSSSLPQREREAAKQLARQIGAELVQIDTGELADANFASNPVDRCFYCKNDLFGRLKQLAAERGLREVVSGANADDTGDFRPGMRAEEKLGVRRPLLEAGMTKQDVRAASKAIGLPTWNKPSMACLASRIPYGAPITPEKLSRIEQAEYVLRDLGFAQCRVRDHETIARIEVPSEELTRVLECKGRIVEALTALGYTYVALDLAGFRSGSMNEPLKR